MRKQIIEGENFFLVQEQEKQWDKFPTIIKSSGYTIDRKAITQPWIWTQMRTIPFRKRSNKPDPLILGENEQFLKFCFPLREVYTLYLKPNCKGMEEAQKELSDYINASSKEFQFVGYSKGGVLIAGLDLKKPTKMAMITPTFGTIMGDESRLKSCIKTYTCLEEKISVWEKMELQVYEKLIHFLGSRRPVDLDISLESDYLKRKNFDSLWKHQVLLVIAECPQETNNIRDFLLKRIGKCLDLDKKGDGIVSLSNQQFLRRYAEEVLLVEATHSTVLNKDETLLKIKSFFR